jgi:tetratricopeptide (TPR) repeat protein
MKSFFAKILSSFILYCFFGSNFSMAQSTIGMTPKSRMLERANDLYESGKFSSANAYLTSNWGKIKDLDYSEAEKSALQLMLLASGIISNETYSVKNGKALMQSTEQRSVAVKLAYHLGHYYFSLSMYQDAIEMLEKTDRLYLSSEEAERVQFEKGVGYFSLKRFDNARPFLREILQIDKSVYKADAQYYLGFIDFSERRFGESAKNFNLLLKHPNYSKAVPFYLAFIANENGDVSEAIQYGENYLSQGDGVHAKEMEQLLASIYFNKSDYDKSVALYEKILVSGNILNSTQRFELGTGYYHLKKFTKAIEQLKPLSSGFDKLAQEANYVLAHSFLQINDKLNARSAFQLVLSSRLANMEMTIARFQFAKLSLESGFEDQGLQGLIRFLKEDPNSPMIPECKEILIRYYAKTNNFRQAIIMMENIGASTANIADVAPRIYFGRGIELFKDLQYDEADRMFSLLGKYKSSSFYASSLFWRGEIAFIKEDFSSCINQLSALVKMNSGSFKDFSIENAWYNLGYAYFELEEYSKAVPWFEKTYSKLSAADNEMKMEAMLRAADCAFMEKQVEKAKSLYTAVQNSSVYGADYAVFQLAVIEGIKSPSNKIKILLGAEKKYPNSTLIPLIAAELADTYLSEEEYELAIPYLKRIPTLVDEDDEMVPESILKLGIAYFNLDKVDESIGQFKQLLKDYPTSTQAKEAIDNAKSLYVESGQIDGYEKFLQSVGLSLGGLQKDSLSFEFAQKVIADANSTQSIAALESYISSFPEGLHILEALNYKAEFLAKEQKWQETAETYQRLAAKGASKYQEKALRQAGKINFFELKNYESALKIFQELSSMTAKPEVLLESLRGEIRCHFYLHAWDKGKSVALRILENEGVSMDDRAFANMVLGYAALQMNEYSVAIRNFNESLALNKAALAAEARYQIALAYFKNNDFVSAEKSALISIEQSGSYEYWITRSYLLLGEISILQKDYFNAKATFKSIVDNCSIVSLKEEASSRLTFVEQKEKGEGLN